jgi:hypothetical protein
MAVQKLGRGTGKGAIGQAPKGGTRKKKPTTLEDVNSTRKLPSASENKSSVQKMQRKQSAGQKSEVAQKRKINPESVLFTTQKGGDGKFKNQEEAFKRLDEKNMYQDRDWDMRRNKVIEVDAVKRRKKEEKDVVTKVLKKVTLNEPMWNTVKAVRKVKKGVERIKDVVKKEQRKSKMKTRKRKSGRGRT